MSNISITNNDLTTPILADASFRDDTLNLAGADVIAAGTILARSVANSKLILFVKGGVTDGNGVPKAILPYAVTTTGAGDVAVRVAVGGKFRKEKLVIDANGDASAVDAVVLDQLRAYGLTAIDVDELNIVDNQ